MQGHSYTNPVYAEHFADPYVWRGGGEYYAVGTGANEAAGDVHFSCEATVSPLLHSPDLAHWRAAGRALVPPAASLGDTFLAPEVACAEGSWHLYYSVGFSDRSHQLRVAKSADPLGPYFDYAGLTDPSTCPFAIDPHPFRDDDGRWYLFHARDFLDLADEEGRPVRAGTALVAHRLATMTELSPDGRTVARARADWQRFAANRLMYGRSFDWHTLEGPCVVKHEGMYFCLYSGGCWQTDTYGVDYVVADSVLDPWSDEGVEAGPRILRSVPGRALGPGHCSVVLGPDDETLYLAYHAWGSDMRARRMYIDELVFRAEGPRSKGPTWTPQTIRRRERRGS
jgi:beta-xylosidase